MVTFGNAILRPGARLASRRASLIPTKAGFVAPQQLVTNRGQRARGAPAPAAGFGCYSFDSWLSTACIGLWPKNRNFITANNPFGLRYRSLSALRTALRYLRANGLKRTAWAKWALKKPLAGLFSRTPRRPGRSLQAHNSQPASPAGRSRHTYRSGWGCWSRAFRRAAAGGRCRQRPAAQSWRRAR
jgi:hypothetical protein